MVESLNKAILNIEMSSMPGHGNFLYLAVTTWGLPRADVDALKARLQEIVHGLFPQPAMEPVTASPRCREVALDRGNPGARPTLPA